jgi:hypothetical protein
MRLLAAPQIYSARRSAAGGAWHIHTTAKYRLMSIVTSMRGQGRGPRGQRALDAEGGRRRATADRQTRMLLAAACYGIQETSALPFPTITGGWNRRKGLGRREEKAAPLIKPTPLLWYVVCAVFIFPITVWYVHSFYVRYVYLPSGTGP